MHHKTGTEGPREQGTKKDNPCVPVPSLFCSLLFLSMLLHSLFPVPCSLVPVPCSYASTGTFSIPAVPNTLR